MKHVCSVTLLATYLLFSTILPMAVPPANAVGDKVEVIGCDGTVWEGSTGIPSTEDQEQIRGTWIGSEANKPGEWVSTFKKNNTFEIAGPGGERYAGSYTCDIKQNPKYLNLNVKESSNPALNGIEWVAIYEINGDTLKYALREPGAKARPASFDAEEGTRIFSAKRKN